MYIGHDRIENVKNIHFYVNFNLVFWRASKIIKHILIYVFSSTDVFRDTNGAENVNLICFSLEKKIQVENHLRPTRLYYISRGPYRGWSGNEHIHKYTGECDTGHVACIHVTLPSLNNIMLNEIASFTVSLYTDGGNFIQDNFLA